MENKPRYQLTPRESELAREIVSAAYSVHSELGPGLLEHVYEICFCHELQKRGIDFQRQLSCPITYDGILFEEAFRLDVLVDDLIVCEIKAVHELDAVHFAQVLTYLRFTGKHVGFAINFHTNLMKHGLRRLVLP
jgi:GxxExxY protein